ncbi:Outer membrane lipoprotein [Companilactobacillus paralimentarius DSM 13238 = JCM 10415]|jgi:ABC-type metal ion transport system, periplasmic component/surface antigen|uniref:Lipoprotein n=1 Tax=Companilactobacillus paralimentarius DSM 13238 = JCM 10415 TaxID=1122151 RepID=A0A0R1PJD6_9LACO|nr:MetQ/NlpA family ABC transporter substrate-binding protein [Companilactobacillus paralimentarius]KAE9565431.1 metal ABC transporter substrate-binding protein [Companilactobacillus paralimentarius]KRL29914.1 Outer membrane lipoprotein [Companilactobacillus paralimentarius DSM 13238 = JCM 10415]MDR4933508.1 MetQ/NlpA family ABC transporter substrate-binding protein [Companilactobacillus paralimentarius]QFR69987.1 MetQ/NlpA family ABC transporter substrate-binding protein [Companilactobacillus 
MKNNKIKAIFLLVVATFSLFLLAGCGSNSSASSTKEKTVKIGITGSDDEVLKAVAKKVKKEGINIKIVEFSDYSQPNTALDQGEIDLNAFQTVIFQNDWNKKHKTHIVSIGSTVIAPMALYSKKIKKVSQIKNGDKIAVANDATNEARGLTLLESAGLIKLDNAKVPGLKDITENKLNLKITPLDAAQTAKSMDDVTASVVNSGVANDSKLDPKTAVYREKITAKSKPYVNIISANKKDKDNPTYKKIVKAYQSKDIAKVIKNEFHGYEQPAWNYKVLN